jgi:hypothetical protein
LLEHRTEVQFVELLAGAVEQLIVPHGDGRFRETGIEAKPVQNSRADRIDAQIVAGNRAGLAALDDRRTFAPVLHQRGQCRPGNPTTDNQSFQSAGSCRSRQISRSHVSKSP